MIPVQHRDQDINLIWYLNYRTKWTLQSFESLHSTQSFWGILSSPSSNCCSSANEYACHWSILVSCLYLWKLHSRWDLLKFSSLRGHSQTTWRERHTYMVGKMSTNVHVGYLDGPPFVHVDMIFSLNYSNMHKMVLFKH